MGARKGEEEEETKETAAANSREEAKDGKEIRPRPSPKGCVEGE